MLDSWKALARVNNLKYRSVPDATRVFGTYRGYSLELMAFHPADGSHYDQKTRLTVTADHRLTWAAVEQGLQDQNGEPSVSLTGDRVANLLRALPPGSIVGRNIEVRDYGRRIVCEQPGLEFNTGYLQTLFDFLRDLLVEPDQFQNHKPRPPGSA